MVILLMSSVNKNVQALESAMCEKAIIRMRLTVESKVNFDG